tara:strand:+ start:7460 stop:8467 length:1008 start_codon:yes stop_codon:yes gene_type:complete
MYISKKGVVETQFNWIFILIIGAVVLILFTGVIVRQKNVSDTSTELNLLESLDSIFSGLETSSGTVSLVAIPNSKIEFGCNAYSVGEVSRQSITSIFAPSFLEGSDLVAMTLAWKLPYKAANLVYLANQQTRYIFVGDSDFAKEIFEMIPDEIKNDGYTNVDVIQNENDRIVRLIFFDEEPTLPNSLRNVDSITSLRVDGNEDTGTLQFFELVDGVLESKGFSNYIKEAGLIGAIFSDEVENYECSMKNVFKKLNIVSKVHKERINRVFDYYSNEAAGSSCMLFYEAEILQISGNLDVLSSSVFSPEDIPAVINAAAELENKNFEVGRLSCTTIY